MPQVVSQSVKKNVVRYFADVEPVYLLYLILLVPLRCIVDVVRVIVAQVFSFQSCMYESAGRLMCVLPVGVGRNRKVPVICSCGVKV